MNYKGKSCHCGTHMCKSFEVTIEDCAWWREDTERIKAGRLCRKGWGRPGQEGSQSTGAQDAAHLWRNQHPLRFSQMPQTQDQGKIPRL